MATAIRAARLFDGVSPVVREDVAVLVDGDRIVGVVDGARASAYDDVLDLGDVTLLPGLIDTHVHLAFDASPDPVGALAAREDDEVRESMAAMAGIAARGGVTTVRDLGDRDYLSLRLRDVAGLPTIVAAGPPITTPGGHCHFLGGVAAPGVDGIRRAVREHAERGVDVIKVMASGGQMTPGTDPSVPQFTAEEMAAAVDEAHRAGLPITAHTHAPAAVAMAVDAGVDGVEHASFWTADGVDADDAVIARAGERRLVVGATGGVVPVEGVAPPPPIALRRPMIIEVMRRLHRAGAQVLPGTDAGIAPLKPHDVLRYALAEMVAVLGVSPGEALTAATSRSADACRLGHRKGRLAEGYDADLLAVGGDPLRDISAVHDIRAVYVRGLRVV